MTPEEWNESEREHYETISGYHDEKAVRFLVLVVFVLAVVLVSTNILIAFMMGAQ